MHLGKEKPNKACMEESQPVSRPGTNQIRASWYIKYMSGEETEQTTSKKCQIAWNMLSEQNSMGLLSKLMGEICIYTTYTYTYIYIYIYTYTYT